MAISDHPLTFASAGTQEFQSVGRFIRVRESTSPVYISIDGAAELEREQGEQIDAGKLNARIRVRSAVAQTVKMTSADNPQDDNRTSVSLAVDATVESGNDNQHLTKTSVGAGASAQVAASNSNRKSLRVSLLSSAVGYVLLGKSGVAATSGGTLEPGMVDYIDTTGALWVFNPQASAIDVWCMEVNKL